MVSSAVERYALCDAGEQLVCMLVQAARGILFNTELKHRLALRGDQNACGDLRIMTSNGKSR
jgi:hypothetical protein